MTTFRLDKEPWIPVLDKAGHTREVSLLEVLEQSQDIARIIADPLESACIQRLLAAIAHVVRHPRYAEEWLVKCWNQRDELLQDMAAYVRERSEVWDLYGDAPFLQDTRLEAQPGGTESLIYARNYGKRDLLFEHFATNVVTPVPSAQAARGLLVIHSCLPGGTGGSNPLNHGEKDFYQEGTLYARLVGWIEGTCLRDTIALSLHSDSDEEAGRPGWEWPHSLPGPVPAQGYADRYTRPTRSVRLRPSSDGLYCEGVKIVNANSIPKDPSDPMILHQEVKGEAKPVSPDVDQAVWRHSYTALARKGKGGLKLVDNLTKPGISMKENGFALRVVTMLATPRRDQTKGWRDEVLPFNLNVIRDEGQLERLSEAIQISINGRNSLEGKLERFGERYLQGGNNGTKASKLAVTSFVDQIAPGFREYWAYLSPAGERLATQQIDIEGFKKECARAYAQTYRQAIDRVAPSMRRFQAEYGKETGGEHNESRKKRTRK